MKIIFLIPTFLLIAACQLHRAPTQPAQNYYQSRWMEAEELLKVQNFEEAEKVLKELSIAAQSAEPEISTKALFELGQINERKGEWLLALAQFKECELKKSNLPGFKAELELPARLAGLYATLGELRMSQVYAKKVESSLQAYMQQISLDQQKGWWAETFFRMGSFPAQAITAENWEDFAKRFHSTSQFLIRSMEMDQMPWSNRSLELSQNFFKKSFENLKLKPVDLEENNVLLGSQVRDRINLLQEILQKIQLYRPPSLDNPLIRSFYQAVEDYEKHVISALHNLRDFAPLSKESEKRNAIEQEGILVNPSRGPIDKSKKDPNL